MAKHLLIAPADGDIGSHLAVACGNAGYAITSGREREEKPISKLANPEEPGGSGPAAEPDGEGESINVIWEARSFISARNLVLAGTNRFDQLDVAILVQEPDSSDVPEVRPRPDRHDSDVEVGVSKNLQRPPLYGALHINSPTTIERYLDAKVTGMMLLARETLAAMVRQQSGTLLMVLSTPTDLPATSVATSAQAAFVACAESLSVEYQNEPVDVALFESLKSDIPGFVSYIVSNLDSVGDGKRYRYGSRSSSRLRLGGR